MTLRYAAEQLTSIAAVRAATNCACVTNIDPSDADLDDLIDAASDAMTVLSGGAVFGRQTVTVFPTRLRDRCECNCGCGLDAIVLDGFDPVVSEVKIDGVALDPADYNLHSGRDGRWALVREADDLRPNSWPSCQALWRPDTEDDTFSITFTYGRYTDYVIEQAAIELVCDFAAENITKTNQLGNGATSASMGGVNVSINTGYTIQERMERLMAGDLGPATSRFMSLYAPSGRVRSEVWAPELEDWNMIVKQ
jgi:hypothetical protein